MTSPDLPSANSPASSASTTSASHSTTPPSKATTTATPSASASAPLEARMIVEPSEAEPPLRYVAMGKDPVGDALLLVMSILVITLSFVMNTQGNSQVCYPGTDIPLPDMCSFRRWTGIDCPGCGMTRAFISIAHGQFSQAWRYNPASLYFFVLVGGQIPFRSLQLWRLWKGREPVFRSGWSYAPAFLFMFLLLGQWLIRVILPSLGIL